MFANAVKAVCPWEGCGRELSSNLLQRHIGAHKRAEREGITDLDEAERLRRNGGRAKRHRAAQRRAKKEETA